MQVATLMHFSASASIDVSSKPPKIILVSDPSHCNQEISSALFWGLARQSFSGRLVALMVCTNFLETVMCMASCLGKHWVLRKRRHAWRCFTFNRVEDAWGNIDRELLNIPPDSERVKFAVHCWKQPNWSYMLPIDITVQIWDNCIIYYCICDIYLRLPQKSLSLSLLLIMILGYVAFTRWTQWEQQW